jgi:hypothetical protein
VLRYRIIKDRWAGFAAQYKRWWWPMWWECNGINTSPSLRLAELVCDNHYRDLMAKEKKLKEKIVEHYSPKQ